MRVIEAELLEETGSVVVADTEGVATIVGFPKVKSVACKVAESPEAIVPMLHKPAGSQLRQTPTLGKLQLLEALAGKGKAQTTPLAAEDPLFFMVTNKVTKV